MNEIDLKRISRLTAILTQLQTKRLLTAAQFAERFNVSVRTIYRDIRALEQAGIPIYTEEGKGYSLMEGYRLPPVMLTENEANALITAEQLVRQNRDTSFVHDYADAIAKIKGVLKHSVKEKANLLAERVYFRQNTEQEHTSNHLAILQRALTNCLLTEINYTDEQGKSTTRLVEPFAVYSTQDNWLLIALCHLRSDFRAFRLDRIQKLHVLQTTFEPQQITLQDYFEQCHTKSLDNP
ncbi:helix-turn-helix transcriptional regulator [Parapedobacter tibetensis]|uniref:helix-turn-helix transcriptional regulator n=1 Tax=Parapedobacter tibetensis TaxID=2972951 RepID=UPI00214D81FD|nr:YafY family protein [Parapedobacter tibetensis]